METLILRLTARLKKLKTDVLKKYKGSLRDPFVHLGAIAAISAPINNVSLLTSDEERGEASDGALFAFPTERIQESPDLSLIQGNSLVAVSPPIMATPQVLGALVGGQDYQWTQNEVTEYAVQPGDSLWSIAEKFNISMETILWANNLNKNSLIQIGQTLMILPVSGVSHQVQKGDTVSEIAQMYKTKADDIISYNDLSGEGDIFIGDILIIPNGVMPPPVQYAPRIVPLADSYFICPIGSPCRITQGLHWYNAVDFSHGKCGEPIYAAAAGEVLKVKLTASRSQWAFGGAGNHLTILHPNGVVTYYGHIQNALVSPGDRVSQGQMIATIGGQPGTSGAGKTTGCHVHFGVTGARNPFAR
jgi:LysM repeat protein